MRGPSTCWAEVALMHDGGRRVRGYVAATKMDLADAGDVAGSGKSWADGGSRPLRGRSLHPDRPRRPRARNPDDGGPALKQGDGAGTPGAGAGADGNRHGGAIASFCLCFPGKLDWSVFSHWFSLLAHQHGDKLLRVESILGRGGQRDAGRDPRGPARDPRSGAPAGLAGRGARLPHRVHRARIAAGRRGTLFAHFSSLDVPGGERPE